MHHTIDEVDATSVEKVGVVNFPVFFTALFSMNLKYLEFTRLCN